MKIPRTLTAMLVILLLTFFICCTQTLSVLKGPSDKYVDFNSSIEFECYLNTSDYNPNTDQIEWCKNDFCTWGRLVEMFNGNLKYKSLPRFNIIVNRTIGQWNLRIENVTERDVGNFKCVVTRRNETVLNKIESKSAALRLVDRPRNVELITSKKSDTKSQLSIVLNRLEVIGCRVEGGMPAPNIYWILLDSSLINRRKILRLIENKNKSLLSRSSFMIIDDQNNNDNANQSIFRLNLTTISNGPTSFTHFSQLKLNASLDLIDKHLMCVVEHDLLEDPIIKPIKIQLKCMIHLFSCNFN
jgi:hypothetical protein